MQHSTVETVAMDDEATFGTIPQLRVQGLWAWQEAALAWLRDAEPEPVAFLGSNLGITTPEERDRLLVSVDLQNGIFLFVRSN